MLTTQLRKVSRNLPDRHRGVHGGAVRTLKRDRGVKAQVEIEKARVSVEVARREAAEQLAEERRGRITDLQHALRMLTPSTKDRKEMPVEAAGKLTSSSTTVAEPAAPTAPGQNHDAEPLSPETAHSDSLTTGEPLGMLSRIRTWFV